MFRGPNLKWTTRTEEVTDDSWDTTAPLPVSGIDQLRPEAQFFQSFVADHHDYCCRSGGYDAGRETLGHPPESFFSEQLLESLNDWRPAFNLSVQTQCIHFIKKKKE